MKTYVTFGQDHIHNINGITFDKNCVAVVNGDQSTVFDLFGKNFCFEYPQQHWHESKIKYFPHGYEEVKP